MSKNWIKLLILSMCTIFLLIGCSDIEVNVKDELEEKFEDEAREDDKKEEKEKENVVESVKDEEDDKEEEKDKEDAKEEDKEKNEKDIAGYWKDDVYVNEYFDLKMELPDKWQRETDENLKLKSGTEKLNYILYANSDLGENIAIFYQDLRDYGGTDEIIASTDVEDFMEVYYAEFKNSNIYDKVERCEDERIGSNKFAVLKMSGEFIKNITIVQKAYFLKKDNYILIIYMTSTSEARTEDLGYNLK